MNYRKLNAVIATDAFPMSQIEEFLNDLQQSAYLTTLDMASGYRQVKLDPLSIPKSDFCTAFTNSFGCLLGRLKGAPQPQRNPRSV